MNDKESVAVAKIVEEHLGPNLVDVSRDASHDPPIEVLVTAKGQTVQSVKAFLDEYRTAPERRKGTAETYDLASFCEHVNRFKDADSVIFASPSEPSLTAVLDYHRAGGDGAPRFGQHRTHYTFPLSGEWDAWQEKDGEKLGQKDFAELIENRIADFADPSTAFESSKKIAQILGAEFAGVARLVELSRGLTVRVGAAVRNAVNLNSGETALSYVTAHADETGAPLTVPSAFLLSIPVFQGGPLYQVPARLRYRVSQGSVSWFYELHRDSVVFEHAFKEARDHAAKATSLPVLLGSPES